MILTNKVTNGVILTKAYPMTQGHLDLIKWASKKVDELTVYVCFTVGETIPVDIRAKWVSDAIKNTVSNVTLEIITEQLGSSEDGRVSDPDVSRTWAKYLMKRNPRTTHFFGSEPYIKMMADSVGVQYEIYDEARIINPISATAIRNDFKGMKQHVACPTIEREYIPRIAIVGLDSCGKSTLVHALSYAMGSDIEVVQEYGRDYCSILTPWDDGKDNFINSYDLEQIAYGQAKLVVAAYRNAYKKDKLALVCDTELITTLGFSYRYLNKGNENIQNMVNFQSYDLYIYMPLLELEDDGTRRIVSQQERVVNNQKLKQLFKDNIHDGCFLDLSGFGQDDVYAMACVAIKNIMKERPIMIKQEDTWY